jgi:hypothetical protein
MTYATGPPPRTPANQEPRADGADLHSYLEADQLVADTQRPVPRAELSRRAVAALWALRIFVIVLSAMVIYTFVVQLRLCRRRAKSHRLGHAGIRRGLMEPLIQGAVLGHQRRAAAPGRLLLGNQGARRDDQPGN